jgi:hypothetical protein
LRDIALIFFAIVFSAVRLKVRTVLEGLNSNIKAPKTGDDLVPIVEDGFQFSAKLGGDSGQPRSTGCDQGFVVNVGRVWNLRKAFAICEEDEVRIRSTAYLVKNRGQQKIAQGEPLEQGDEHHLALFVPFGCPIAPCIRCQWIHQ